MKLILKKSFFQCNFQISKAKLFTSTMGIAHEMISYSEGQTSYRVRVDSFKHKMNTWRAGRLIRLKTFKIDGLKLRLELYPNGETQEEVNHVSIYIKNNSNVDIDILFDAHMGTKEIRNDIKFHIEAWNSLGWGKFYDHEDDDDYDDEAFEITVTVKKLWKQFHEDGVNNNVSDNIQGVQQRLESLEKSMKSLIEKSGEAAVPKPQIPQPDCPICLENMNHETRIMQCYGGHPMCGGCHGKLEEPKICPSCKMGMIGRNYGLENYLRTLFSDQNRNGENVNANV